MNTVAHFKKANVFLWRVFRLFLRKDHFIQHRSNSCDESCDKANNQISGGKKEENKA